MLKGRESRHALDWWNRPRVGFCQIGKARAPPHSCPSPFAEGSSKIRSANADRRTQNPKSEQPNKPPANQNLTDRNQTKPPRQQDADSPHPADIIQSRPKRQSASRRNPQHSSKPQSEKKPATKKEKKNYLQITPECTLGSSTENLFRIGQALYETDLRRLRCVYVRRHSLAKCIAAFGFTAFTDQHLS